MPAKATERETIPIFSMGKFRYFKNNEKLGKLICNEMFKNKVAKVIKTKGKNTFLSNMGIS